MRPIVLFQGPVVTFQGSPSLGAIISERTQFALGAVGIAFLIGTAVWLARGGVERLPLRQTQPWDF